MILDHNGAPFAKEVQTEKKYTLDEYIRRTSPNAEFAGINVNRNTAIRQAEVYSCIKIIAESIAMLPLKVYKIDDKTDSLTEVSRGHRLRKIYSERPCEYTTTQELIETIITNLLTFGNSYCYLNRRHDGKVVEIIPFRYPNNVSVDMDTNGKVYYTYVTNDHQSRNKIFVQDEILHLKLNGQSGFEGMAPIDKAAEAMGIAIANARYTSKTFENAAMTSGVLSVGNERELTDNQYSRLEESYKDYQGVNAAGKILILEGGATFQTTSQSNQQAQVLELANFSREQIGHIFRVPVQMLNDTSAQTYSNVEQNGLNFLRNTLMPHIRKIETALNELVDIDYCVKFDTDQYMRGDSETKMRVCDGLAKLGALSVNEIRKDFGMNPIDGADVYQVITNNAEFGTWEEAEQMREDARVMAQEAHTAAITPDPQTENNNAKESNSNSN